MELRNVATEITPDGCSCGGACFATCFVTCAASCASSVGVLTAVAAAGLAGLATTTALAMSQAS